VNFPGAERASRIVDQAQAIVTELFRGSGAVRPVS